MNFTPTPLAGVTAVALQRLADDRGWFQRQHCAATFRAHGLPDAWRQTSLCFNECAGTLRGMHWQAPPHEEIKMVAVLRGRVFDVVVDLRPESPTFGRHATFTLDAAEPLALVLPGRCAHGYLTLTDDVLLEYHMTADYVPTAARVLRFDDPQLSIAWPRPVICIAERDRTAPGFADLTLV